MRLEIVTDRQRRERIQSTLQSRFPSLDIVVYSSFYCIFGCDVTRLSEEDKAWLQAMIDAQAIHRYRCKEREDH